MREFHDSPTKEVLFKQISDLLPYSPLIREFITRFLIDRKDLNHHEFGTVRLEDNIKPISLREDLATYIEESGTRPEYFKMLTESLIALLSIQDDKPLQPAHQYRAGALLMHLCTLPIHRFDSSLFNDHLITALSSPASPSYPFIREALKINFDKLTAEQQSRTGDLLAQNNDLANDLAQLCPVAREQLHIPESLTYPQLVENLGLWTRSAFAESDTLRDARTHAITTTFGSEIEFKISGKDQSAGKGTAMQQALLNSHIMVPEWDVDRNSRVAEMKTKNPGIHLTRSSLTDLIRTTGKFEADPRFVLFASTHIHLNALPDDMHVRDRIFHFRPNTPGLNRTFESKFVPLPIHRYRDPQRNTYARANYIFSATRHVDQMLILGGMYDLPKSELTEAAAQLSPAPDTREHVFNQHEMGHILLYLAIRHNRRHLIPAILRCMHEQVIPLLNVQNQDAVPTLFGR